MVAQLRPLDTDDNSPSRRRDLQARMEAIVGALEKEAEERVGKRNLIEKRWLEDLAQYHGRYDDETARNLSVGRKSRLFINQTRPKTNAMEARLADMLFPTDDRNWGIEPTPVPELASQAEEAARMAAQLVIQATQAQETGDPSADALAQQAQEAQQMQAEISARLDEARKRARAMEDEIDDHLRECRYQSQAREVIADACRLGTGIMKGPVIGGRSRRQWQEVTVIDGETGEAQTVHAMVEATDPRPVFWRVNPWSFFPDFDATSMDDCESVFERHLLNKKQLRALAKQPGFDPDAIRRLLRDQPRYSTPSYIADLRSITGAYHDSATDRYHVWEYHGPLTAEDLRHLSEAAPGAAGGLGEEVAEIEDPLQEVQVVIWFCQNEILKAGPHPLDSGESIYSVFCLEKDEASIFGFGVPYLMRDSQRALNAAWRMMMDNSGLSTGPQIVVNRDVVEPSDGSYELTARKVWYRNNSAPAGAPAFETYEINSHQAELANIIELARRFIDEETAVPMIAQGEQGPTPEQTATGMSILTNAANTVFRRIVKNFDDDLTTPCIRRIYDWLMQFSDKEHIKGDFEVDARGTSVLLVREMQSANLMALLNNYSGHPVIGPFLKRQGLPLFRRLVQTMMIPAEEAVATDEELEAEAARQAQEPPPPEPEIMKIEAEMNRAVMEQETKIQLALIQRETEMMKLAAQQNMTLDQVRAKLADSDAERGLKERKMAVDAAMAERHGKSGGWF